MNKFGSWRTTKTGLSVLGLVELLLSYAFISVAIDRGNLWYYLLSLIFFVLGMQNILKLIGVIYSQSKLRTTKGAKHGRR